MGSEMCIRDRLNGFYWATVEGYRGSYLTAYNNGDYGIYAFDAVDGVLEHSYASGSPDAGFLLANAIHATLLLIMLFLRIMALDIQALTRVVTYILSTQFLEKIKVELPQTH